MAKSIAELLGTQEDIFKNFEEEIFTTMRVAMPGIIQSFDYETQTASVQLAIRERLKSDDLSRSWVNIPVLVDVPIVLPKAGGYVLTMPINKGDECLVIFADMCIDAWFSNGDIQNQIDKRRHDLSDGFAILGTWSQPKKISNYSNNSTQLRTLDGTTYIDLKPGQVNVVASDFKFNGREVATII